MMGQFISLDFIGSSLVLWKLFFNNESRENEMPVLKTQRMRLDGATPNELDFKYQVSVNSEGLFTCTLPEDIAELLMNRGIELRQNRMKRYGYFENETLEGLNGNIEKTCEEYLSRELIQEKIVLKYQIEAYCSYWETKDGTKLPNGSMEDGDKKGSGWKHGTVDLNVCNPAPFGLLVYVHPCLRQDFKYKSGTEKTEYENLCYTEYKNKLSDNLKWLDGLCSMRSIYNLEVKEIDYTEDVGEFFVDLIKSIFILSEKIRDHLEPESIKMMAEKKVKLLSG